MDLIAFLISAVTLLLGTALGFKGWFDPAWAAALVRLQPRPDQPEGIAEFRGTFGGMFAGLHLVALILLLIGDSDTGAAVCWVLAAGWWGTAAARAWSMAVDPPARHPFQRFSTGLEVVVGLLIAANPIAQLLGVGGL